MIVSSEDFVNAIESGKNLDAEHSFKSAMKDKMVMKHNTELILQTVEDTTGVHIMVTYLEQT